MKQLSLAIFLTFVLAVAYSQDGIYLTYEDYKNEKRVEVDANSLMYRKAILFKINGKEQQYKYDEVFGVWTNGGLYRFAGEKKIPVKLLGPGTYYLWICRWNDIAVRHDDDNTVNYYISKDIQSPIFYFQGFNSFQKLAEQHPEFKPVYDCLVYQKENEKRPRFLKQNMMNVYSWVAYCISSYLPH